MKLHGHQPVFIGLFLCYSNREHGRQFMHQDGGKILTSETSQHFTILDHRLLHYSSTAKRRVVLVAEGTHRRKFMFYLKDRYDIGSDGVSVKNQGPKRT
uniref:Uncharacterized protein n=1 Tax=Aegilops tauschii subsp. strangulata TaxID=200361 RepID=A0A453LAT0_AEGTS